MLYLLTIFHGILGSILSKRNQIFTRSFLCFKQWWKNSFKGKFRFFSLIMVANSPSKNLLIICIHMAFFITCLALVLQNRTVLLNGNTVTWLNWDLPCSYMPLCQKCFGWKPFSPPLFSSISCLHHLSTWPPHILFSIKSHHLMIFF
jgi:hypothetical protein